MKKERRAEIDRKTVIKRKKKEKERKEGNLGSGT